MHKSKRRSLQTLQNNLPLRVCYQNHHKNLENSGVYAKSEAVILVDKL